MRFNTGKERAKAVVNSEQSWLNRSCDSYAANRTVAVRAAIDHKRSMGSDGLENLADTAPACIINYEI